MKKVLMGLAVLPLMAGVAVAGQPLSDQQMDRVTAGFFAFGSADAEGHVGESGVVITATATLGQVFNVNSATTGEFTSRLWKSISAAQSATVTSTITPGPIPGTGGAG
jgi:hypothetical protein